MGWLSRNTAAREITEIEQAIRTAPRNGGPFCMAVFGPKDPKTTTAAAVAREMAALRAETTVLACANTDMGTLRAVLMPAGAPPPRVTLLDLGLALLGLVRPTDATPERGVQLHRCPPLVLRGFGDLDPFLERVGPALYLLSNDGVAPWVFADLQRQQVYGPALSAAFHAIRLHASVTVIDQGRTQAGPVTDAILQAADQLVIPVPAKPVELNLITSGDGALVQLATRGYHELVARSVLAVTGMSAELDPYGTASRLAEHAGRGLFGSVVPVPYDRAVAGRDHTALQQATRLAYLQITGHVARAMAFPRLAHPAPAAEPLPRPASSAVFSLRPVTPPDAVGE